MDLDKLERLRARYAGAAGDQIYDERFRRVAEMQFSGGVRTKPYSGQSTFLDAPSQTFAEGLDVALIGVPMDLGVTNRPGAQIGRAHV